MLYSENVNHLKKHISMTERIKLCSEWDGKPYELNEEDRQWVYMQSVGNEIIRS